MGLTRMVAVSRTDPVMIVVETEEGAPVWSKYSNAEGVSQLLICYLL
jgi:hypothetical protein